jgi:uncharacterized protein
MVAAVMVLDLHLPSSHSLKDKRQIIRSIKDKARQKYYVAFGELDFLDKWQMTKIGFAIVNKEPKLITETFEKIKLFIVSDFTVILINESREYL